MGEMRQSDRDEPFDPRRAALTHAGAAADRALGCDSGESLVLGELASAVACGLVYVGDQIANAGPDETVALTPIQRAEPTISPAFVARLVKALERIRDHEEHIGSGPPDDEMREIAQEALRIGYPTSDELPEPESRREVLGRLVTLLDPRGLNAEFQELVERMISEEVADGGAGE